MCCECERRICECQMCMRRRRESVSCSCSRGSRSPRGPMGPRGPRGPQGWPGSDGLHGERGPRGSQGIQGERGESGEQGPQGVQGLQGLRGESGEQGPQGVQGLQGLRGEPGEQGPQGVQGLQGLRGEAGPPGPEGIADLIDAMAVISPIGSPKETIPCINSGAMIPTYELFEMKIEEMSQTEFNKNTGMITFNATEEAPNTHTYLVTYTVTGTIGIDDAMTITPFINELPQAQWQTAATTNSNHTTVTNSSSFVYNNMHFGTETQNNLTFQVKTLSGRPITNVYGSYHIVQFS